MTENIAENGKEILLSLKNVDISFGKGKKRKNVVSNATFNIYKGETFSLVGESGSGKTTIARAIMRINNCSSGEILYKGIKISGKISSKLDKEIIKKIQMVFQDPASSLNERATVDYIVSEGLYNFKLYSDEDDRLNKVKKIIKEVGLLEEHLSRYPHEFSGGQRQRIGLARAIVMEPELIIADEPISALDVSIRAQILNLLNKFKKEKNLTTLFIAHDLSIVRFISDRIAVIYKGNIVEIAEAEELFKYPMHPYTMSLISAVPIPDPLIEIKKKLYIYNPNIHDYSKEKPRLEDIGNNHLVFGNESEIKEYKRRRERKIDYKIYLRRLQNDNNINEEKIASTPKLDIGGIYFTMISFIIPILGFILLLIFKRKNCIKNYKALKKGLLINFILTMSVVGVFLLALLLAVI